MTCLACIAGAQIPPRETGGPGSLLACTCNARSGRHLSGKALHVCGHTDSVSEILNSSLKEAFATLWQLNLYNVSQEEFAARIYML